MAVYVAIAISRSIGITVRLLFSGERSELHMGRGNSLGLLELQVWVEGGVKGGAPGV